MSSRLHNELTRFYIDHKFNSKGKLSVALVITEHAKKRGLPLDTESLLTEGGGQVYGLGKGAVQNILARHGINKILAQEGGRTSRGSIGNMREYVEFLNTFSENELATIELFWIEKVNLFFSGKPLKIKLDNSQSLRSLIRDLIQQADSRQKESQGVYYVGAILQHLVGAFFVCVFGFGFFSHNSFSFLV